jgi:hypothetical protein
MDPSNNKAGWQMVDFYFSATQYLFIYGFFFVSFVSGTGRRDVAVVATRSTDMPGGGWAVRIGL